ncbi:MAG: S-methyl-5'-thioadenosine phosphorylase [Candidatus Lokiarchaeota archaeon]|nr:S-methyl-5'-thioadenosine phosphorylase [Candidatus Lokiarchaeota archaeon]
MEVPKDVQIGIIGGTGADIDLQDVKKVKPYTPYGQPSDFIQVGFFAGHKVAFLSRHGPGHQIPPHMLNFRANLWALKELGVTRVFSPCAVGSLRKELDKGDFVIVDQYIDRTRKRLDTFYEGGQVCHISQADPFCPEMNRIFYEAGKKVSGLKKIVNGGTYVCIEGPRFSTRAESKVFHQWGADVIGMTVYPEAVLAAELAMCYSTIATVTDLDVWAAVCPKCGVVPIGPACPTCNGNIKPLAVSVDEILETMEQNAKNLKKLIEIAIPNIPRERHCNCGNSLLGAVL